MESFLRVPFGTDGATVTHPPEFYIWRRLIDLSSCVDTTPAQTLAVETAFHNMEVPADQQVPVQHRPGPALRDRLTENAALRAYAVEEPHMLPVSLQTVRWRQLCQWCAEVHGLSGTEQVGLAGILSSMGFYRYLASLPFSCPPTDPHGLLLRVRITHARTVVDQTPRAVADSVSALEDVVECGDLSVVSRLGAATTLVVLHSQQRLRDLDRVSRFCMVAARLAGELGSSMDWRNLLHMSTYWRAVSFAPFLQGDHRATAEQLDWAESFARSLPRDTCQQRWAGDMNHHPLMETRTKAAVVSGDLDLALVYATELRDRDPLDGKVHMLLGEVRARRGEHEFALASYFAAAALGAPYHALAWSKAADAASHVEDASYFLSCAYRSDPWSVTPLVMQEHVARRAGDERLAQWASHTARRLTSRREARS
jgi:hypothetical protein